MLLYSTASTREEGLRIARALIDERLAGCVNVLPGMHSVYRFNGKVDESSEAVLIVKTLKSLAGKAAERICQLHSYEIPCVIEIPVTGGHKPYLDGMTGEITSA